MEEEQRAQEAEALLRWVERLVEGFSEALPRTGEEWKEAFFRLDREHQELRRAAERVLTVAMVPGQCKPTSKKEDGAARKIVGTIALEELGRALYGE